jgi:hypothetical protein
MILQLFCLGFGLVAGYSAQALTLSAYDIHLVKAVFPKFNSQTMLTGDSETDKLVGYASGLANPSGDKIVMMIVTDDEKVPVAYFLKREASKIKIVMKSDDTCSETLPEVISPVGVEVNKFDLTDKEKAFGFICHEYRQMGSQLKDLEKNLVYRWNSSKPTLIWEAYTQEKTNGLACFNSPKLAGADCQGLHSEFATSWSKSKTSKQEFYDWILEAPLGSEKKIRRQVFKFTGKKFETEDPELFED